MLTRVAVTHPRTIIFGWIGDRRLSRYFGIFDKNHPAYAALKVWLRNNGVDDYRIIARRGVAFEKEEDFILAMISFTQHDLLASYGL